MNIPFIFPLRIRIAVYQKLSIANFKMIKSALSVKQFSFYFRTNEGTFLGDLVYILMSVYQPDQQEFVGQNTELLIVISRGQNRSKARL